MKFSAIYHPRIVRNSVKHAGETKRQTHPTPFDLCVSGSIGSNGSGQGWTTQVEELAEHLAADFDGSLSALAASDLATAVASYNMR